MEARPQKGPARADDPSVTSVLISDASPVARPQLMPRAFYRFTRADQGRRRSADAATSGQRLPIVEVRAPARSRTEMISNVVGGDGQVELLIPVGAAGHGDDAP